MTETKAAGILRSADIEAAAESFSHPWNPDSEIRGTRMSGLAGLSRTGVSRAEIPPGKESFVYHSHYCEEEWIYILSGEALALIDGKEHRLGAGDFIGFPTPSVAHHLRNTGSEPLVYLMGGECKDLEVADFPDLDRRMIRRGPEVTVYPLSAGAPFRRE